MDSSDQAWWLQDSEHNENNNTEPTLYTDAGNDFDLNVNNNLVSKIPSYSIRKMDSSDRNRWLQEAAEQVVINEGSSSYTESPPCSESTNTSTSSKSRSYGIRKMDSSDRNRWLQEAVQEDITNDKQSLYASSVSNSESNKSNNTLSSIYDRTEPANLNTYLGDSDSHELNNNNNSTLCVDNISNSDSHTSNSLSNKNQTYSVRRMDSFDTPWWLKDESDESKLSSNGIESTKHDHSLTKSPEVTMSHNYSPVSYGVRKMDSFDSPWWLSGDEAKQVNSLSDNSIQNQRIEENEDNSYESLPTDPENKVNVNVPEENKVDITMDENHWWLQNGFDFQLETDTLKSIEKQNMDEQIGDSYLDSNKLDTWNKNYPTIKKMDSLESQWWEPDQKNSDARSTSISIDWSRDGPELLSNQLKSTPTDSPLKNILGVTKMDSLDSPSWLASAEESESQSHEPKQTSSGDVVSSSSKHNVEELVDSSPDWWGEKHQSDDFVRTKRTSLRIKKIESIVNETVDEPINNCSKEPNLQDELDQLMLFIGGCRNIDELLGNEEPPPAAPKTPSDTDSGTNSHMILCEPIEYYIINLKNIFVIFTFETIVWKSELTKFIFTTALHNCRQSKTN